MKILWLIPVMCLMVAGCRGGWQMKQIEYSVKNASEQDLQNVVVGIGENHLFKHGVLITGSHSGFSGHVSLGSDNKVTFNWQGSDGKTYKASLFVSRSALLDKLSCQFVIGRDMQVRQEWRFPVQKSDDKGSISTYNIGR